MNTKNEEKIIYKFFEWALVLKVINAIWQITLGWIILFDRKLKDNILQAIFQELKEHPDNLFATHLESLLERVNHSTELFIGIYILIDGIIKIFLVFGLMKKWLWTYPLAIYIFLITLFYEIYRYNHSHSPLLLILSIMEVITILLVQHEYKILKKR